jgi:hypothetical protein
MQKSGWVKFPPQIGDIMEKHIKILKSFSCSICGNPVIGSVICVGEKNADDLIRAGYAEEVDEPKRKNAMAKTRGRRKAIKE